jgi:hypothetical protein
MREMVGDQTAKPFKKGKKRKINHHFTGRIAVLFVLM